MSLETTDDILDITTMLSSIDINKDINVEKEISVGKEEQEMLIDSSSSDEENKQSNKIKNPIQMLRKICKQQYRIQQKANIWGGSIFESIDKLKIDHSGKVGEKFLKSLCEECKIDFTYHEDINSTDGTYDLIINNKKVELKTARQSNSGAFQHEGLRNSGCDYYIFLDIKPNSYYITILKKFNLDGKCPYTGRKPHKRKDTTDVYKFDLSETNIQKMSKQGITIEITDEVDMQTVKQFFINNII